MNFKEHVLSCNISNNSEGMENASSESSLGENEVGNRSYIDNQKMKMTTMSIARYSTGKGH